MNITYPKFDVISYRGERCGKLVEDFYIQTPLRPDKLVVLDTGYMYATLSTDGLLYVRLGSIWNFGTKAIDTLAMVYASLPHDVFCEMTNRGLLPWSFRHKADKFFRQCLADAGERWSSIWRFPGVVFNSQLIARFQRVKHEESN